MDKQSFEELLTKMVRAGASSLHLIPGRPPCIRVQRKFVVSEHASIMTGDVEELTRDFLFEDHRQRLQRCGHVDVLYVARSGQRFRTTVMRQDDGLSLLLRPVSDQPPKLADLELPQQIESCTHYRTGLVLVTGFFGSGKTTTLAAMVDKLNHETLHNIVTVEDPIEFRHPQARALLHQREVGVHVDSFASGIRQAVRVGAEIIAVTDLADQATLDAALSAAESGCLVLAALEASSVIGACQRLLSIVPDDARARMRARLASEIRAIAAQTLLPRSHHQGRVPQVEILLNNAAVRQAIRNGRLHELTEIMNRYRGLGMQTTDAALRGLLARHLITPEEALQHAINRDHVQVRPSSPTAGAAR